MILVKLGGSVITDKSKELTARKEAISRLTQEIADSGQKCIIVHGGGSFGHIKAKKYCLKQGTGHPEYKQGIFDVQADMRRLNAMVVDAFHQAGMSVATVPAGAITVFEDGVLADFPTDVFEHYVKIGITPITFGDVVVDRLRGVSICSGDDIMLRLASELDVSRCIFVTQVDGIYSSYPPCENEKPVSVIKEGEKVNFIDTDTDVTGGMKRKLDLMFDIARQGCDVIIINGLAPGRLKEAMGGKPVPGTIIRSG